MTTHERAPAPPRAGSSERSQDLVADVANYISWRAQDQPSAIVTDNDSARVERARRYGLALARKGVPCFPCCDLKSPTTPHGFKDASCDLATVERLWNEHPGPLVAYPTGALSGFDVLDLDLTKHSEAGAWLAMNSYRLPSTTVYGTRSGGLHFVFEHANGAGSTASKIALGVDTRGDRGYAIYWPAARFPLLCRARPAPWPPYLLDELMPVRSAPSRPMALGDVLPAAALSGVVRRVARAREGERNTFTFWGACRAGELVRAGLISAEDAIDTITEAAMRAGLDQREAHRTARSGVLTGQGV